MTDDELKALVASLSVAHKEMLASNAASKRELDLQLAKTDAQLTKQIAETDAQLTKQIAETDAQISRTEAQIAKTEAQLEKTDQKLDRLAELVGNISNNQGDIAEEFFYTSFAKNPKLGDIHFDSISRNLNNRIGNLQEEYDLLLINGDTLAVIEVKSKAHVSDMEKLVNRKIPNFQKLFKVYKDFHCYAGVATLVTNPDLIEKAKELGLFLVTQQGDHASIVQTGRLLH